MVYSAAKAWAKDAEHTSKICNRISEKKKNQVLQQAYVQISDQCHVCINKWLQSSTNWNNSVKKSKLESLLSNVSDWQNDTENTSNYKRLYALLQD